MNNISENVNEVKKFSFAYRLPPEFKSCLKKCEVTNMNYFGIIKIKKCGSIENLRILLQVNFLWFIKLRLEQNLEILLSLIVENPFL